MSVIGRFPSKVDRQLKASVLLLLVGQRVLFVGAVTHVEVGESPKVLSDVAGERFTNHRGSTSGSVST